MYMCVECAEGQHFISATLHFLMCQGCTFCSHAQKNVRPKKTKTERISVGGGGVSLGGYSGLRCFRFNCGKVLPG